MPRTSSSFIMRRSSPSILISVPEYLPNRMRSPSFSARGNTLPSSLILPLPIEMTSPSCGLSLAESGMMRPPRVVPASSMRRTRMRSWSGVNFVAIFADSFRSNSVDDGESDETVIALQNWTGQASTTPTIDPDRPELSARIEPEIWVVNVRLATKSRDIPGEKHQEWQKRDAFVGDHVASPFYE